MKNLPAWVKAIPESQSHGSGTLQKRLWRLTSDLVRIRDWYAYKGLCIATGAYIGHWSEGDAGHWKSYAVCNGLFKFNLWNIHLQSKSSNGWGGQEIGHSYGQNLEKRYYVGIIDFINNENKITPLKFTTEQVLNLMKDRLKDLGDLPEQPDYYQRASTLLENERTIVV